MSRGGIKRAIPTIVMIVMIVIVVVGVVAIIRGIFFERTSETEVQTNELLSIAADRDVLMRVRGPIVADEETRSYEVTVSPSSRSLVLYRGYRGEEIDSIRLSNNTPAYEEFVYALDRAQMMDGDEGDGDDDEVRGICATGGLYEFEIRNNNQTLKRLWTSTCGRSSGTLVGDRAHMQNLFLLQIPGQQDVLEPVRFFRHAPERAILGR